MAKRVIALSAEQVFNHLPTDWALVGLDPADVVYTCTNIPGDGNAPEYSNPVELAAWLAGYSACAAHVVEHVAIPNPDTKEEN